MKYVNRITLITIALVFLAASSLQAQFRDQEHRSADYTGPVIKKERPEAGNWRNLFNMTMDHSYSMLFTSFGSQSHSLNAYTNTMHFFFSDDLTGRLDLSLLHSPFGSSFTNSNDPGVQFVIRNAELNYQLGERSNIRIQFQQVPSHGFGFGTPYGSHFYNNPFPGRNY